MREILFRTGNSLTDKDVIQVRIVFSDGLTIPELEAVRNHLDITIAQKKGMMPKGSQ